LSKFGGMVLTNKGYDLRIKAQSGSPIRFTRIAVGDGIVGSNPIVKMNQLISEIKSLPISKFKIPSGGRAVVETGFADDRMKTGFYLRELGVFADDLNGRELLYCYGNCRATAQYVEANAGLFKTIQITVLVGNATNVSAVFGGEEHVPSKTISVRRFNEPMVSRQPQY
jgi:hypothetical protein